MSQQILQPGLLSFSISLEKLYDLILSLFVLLVSYYFSFYYTSGDQYHYIQYYNAIANSDIRDAYSLQRRMLSAAEPMYSAFAWLFSGIISKNLFGAILNSILAFLTISYFKYFRINRKFITFFILTNFYILVLYFAADRLKLAMIFFIAGLYCHYVGRNFSSKVLFVLAFLSHFQIMILFFPYVSVRLVTSLKYLAKNYTVRIRQISIAIIIITILTSLGILFKQYLIAKAQFYLSFDISEMIKPLIFLILCYLFLENKEHTTLAFLPLIGAAFLLSGDRITMIAYLLFLHLTLDSNNDKFMGYAIYLSVIRVVPRLLLLWAFSFYFAIKGFLFIQNILVYGNGFP